MCTTPLKIPYHFLQKIALFFSLFTVLIQEKYASEGHDDSLNSLCSQISSISPVENIIHYTAHPEYKKLTRLYALYNRHQKCAPVPFFSLKSADKSRMILLSQKLQEHGFSCTPNLDTITKVLKDFQKAHALRQTGTLNRQTLKYLNTDLKTFLPKILWNMEQWKKMNSFHRSACFVNIPSFTLYYIDNLKPTLCKKVIVGKKCTPTPVFWGYITHAVTHPSWYVPPKHAHRLKGNGSYTSQNGRLVKKPGPSNPLGKIKFLITPQTNKNQAHAIIMHDTPKKKLFNHDVRMDSLGCVRVEDVENFATLLMPRYVEEKKKDTIGVLLQKALDKKKSATFVFDVPCPLYVMYLTVYFDGENPHFLKDIYDHEPDEDQDEDEEDSDKEDEDYES